MASNKWCNYCNNTGKVWSAFLGNFVPCETENDCQMCMGDED